MASEVGICNMALAHIGEDGVVVSIAPPDGSTEAGHCARFFGIARSEALEMQNWAFAAKRAVLAQLTNDSTAWGFKFALPSDCIKARKVLPYGAYDETKSMKYEVEGTSLYCNDEAPTLIYTRAVTDTTKYTSGFTSCFSYLLSSYIAGPITKKAATVQALRNMAISVGAAAAATDANASSSETHNAPAGWMTARGGTGRIQREVQDAE